MFDYPFVVDTAPVVTGDVDRSTYVGATASFRFEPRAGDVVEYDYWVVDQNQTPTTPRRTVAAQTDGTAHATHTSTASGRFWLKVQSRNADGSLSSVRTSFVPVDGAAVTIDRVGGEIPGQPAVLTFSSPMPGIAEYVYTVNVDPSSTTTVAAGPDGRATVSWTPASEGQQYVSARARNAAGVLSDEGSHWFTVDGSPMISSEQFPQAVPGARLPGAFQLTPRLPEVVEYLYTVDEGAELTLPAAADGTASLEWTPPYDGFFLLTARSRSADGTLSSPGFYGFYISSAPLVASDEYPEFQESGWPGVPGTFRLTPQLPGVTEYGYTVDLDFTGPGPETVVPAQPDGSASFTWVPEQPGLYIIAVHGRDAAGQPSEVREYLFWVGPPPQPLRAEWVLPE